MYYKIKELLEEARSKEAAILVTLCDLEDEARELSHRVDDLERAWEAAETAAAEGEVSWELVDLLGVAMLDDDYEYGTFAFNKCDDLRAELAHWTTIRQHLEAAFEEYLKDALEDWD